MSVTPIYRLARAFVDRFIASHPQPPAAIMLDLDHSADPTHGQQEFNFYNHYDGHHRDLPLLRFAGLSGPFVTAAPRPGQRPTGAENAMIVRRVLKRPRAAWPQTRIARRGDARFANPEWMQLAMADPQLDFLFGPAGNRALPPWAEPFLAPHRRRLETARRAGFPLPTPTHSLITSPTGPNPGRGPCG